jgi:hypothetical protein
VTELEQQLEASLKGRIASRFDLPTEAQLIAVDAQLSRLLREGPPKKEQASGRLQNALRQ